MKYFTLLFLMISNLGYTQKKIRVQEHLLNPKGKLFLGFGTEYRLTPILKVKNEDENVGPIPFKVLSNSSFQNSGITLNYNLKYFFTNSLSLTFNNSFKRSLLLYDGEISAGYGAKAAEQTIAIDYQLLLDYHFRLNKEAQLYARLGLERMNTNTHYINKFSFYNPDGSLSASVFSTYDFSYFSNNFAIGYIRNKLDLTIGYHGSNNTEFAEVQANFYVPYIKLNYVLTKL